MPACSQALGDLRQAGVRVAHDRQQRVQEQRDQRRPHADGAGERDQEGEQRERRNGLDHAGEREHRLRHARPACAATMPSGTPTSDARPRASRTPAPDARPAGGRSPAPNSAPRKLAAASAARSPRNSPPTSAKREPCRARRARSAAPSSLVDRSFELLRTPPKACGKPLRRIAPVQQHRVVGREEAPVVLEHARCRSARSWRRWCRCPSRRSRRRRAPRRRGRGRGRAAPAAGRRPPSARASRRARPRNSCDRPSAAPGAAPGRRCVADASACARSCAHRRARSCC